MRSIRSMKKSGQSEESSSTDIFYYYFTKSSEFHEPVADYLDEIIGDQDLQTSVIVLMEMPHTC